METRQNTVYRNGEDYYIVLRGGLHNKWIHPRSHLDPGCKGPPEGLRRVRFNKWLVRLASATDTVLARGWDVDGVIHFRGLLR